MRRLIMAGCLAALAALGCSTKSGTTGRGETVLALVAASTKDAVHEVGKAFTRETGSEVRLNADDSSKLAMQIVNGAPADLFLSANVKWADFIKDKGLAQETHILLGNTLVIVVPKGNPGGVSKPEDLTGAAVKKLALAGPTVPAGIYARQALRHLKLWDELEKERKIVIGENVRVTLSYVEQREAEAGIVYGTDARISDRVQEVCSFPPSSHDAIIYPLVLLRGAEKNAAARRFFDYLQSATAAEVFKKYGFTRPTAN
jgi:molybdate transport system substrate-binding protein